MLLSAPLPSWKLALDAAGKSSKKISSHLDSAKRLAAYLTTEGLPLEPEGIRAFLIAERERTTPALAAKHYLNLRVYFHWLLAEGEIKEDPMVRVEKPQVAEEAKPFCTDAELAALLKVTRGQDFEARRDHTERGGPAGRDPRPQPRPGPHRHRRNRPGHDPGSPPPPAWSPGPGGAPPPASPVPASAPGSRPVTC